MHATIALSLDGPDAHLRVDGELDIAYRHRLRNHAADVLDCSTGDLLVDLGGVTLVDCSCLRTLDRLRRELVADGRRFVITDASLAFGLVAYLAEYDGLLRAIAETGVRTLRARRVLPVPPAAAPVGGG